MEDSQEPMDLVMAETQHFKREESVLGRIKELSHKNFKREVCGFLGFCEQTKRYVIQHEKNISPEPHSYFLINPLNYLLFKEKYKMVAIFHSHIKGSEMESEFDTKMANNCCQPFLIYSLNSKKFNIYTPETIEADVNRLERIKEAR